RAIRSRCLQEFPENTANECRPFEEMVEGLYQGWQASHETLSRLPAVRSVARHVICSFKQNR
ncbi:MAG: hypothetical protein ACPGH0_06510, partial [Opitutales bacterium]